MGVLEGLAIAVLVGGVLGYTVVLIIRDVRRWNRRRRNPDSLIEVLEPGETPILKPRIGYRQGGLITIDCFGPLPDSPLSAKMPPNASFPDVMREPPSSSERS